MEQQKNTLLSLFGEEGAGEQGVDAALPSGEIGSDAAAEASQEEVSREQAFDDLISGEYKDLYDAKVSQIVQKRLKQSKEGEQRLGQLEGLVTALSQKYGVDPADLDRLQQAVVSQTVPPKIRSQALAGKVYEDLSAQAKELKKVYPTFDVAKELKNPKFASLLRIPTVDMQTAYELTHKEEILPAVIHATARQVESRIARSMMAGGSRPAENGNAAQSTPLTKQDVSTFTPAQMDDICKRVSRGEKIFLR